VYHRIVIIEYISSASYDHKCSSVVVKTFF